MSYKIEFKPIGFVKTDVSTVPRHWTISDVKGKIVIDEVYTKGINPKTAVTFK